MRGMSYGGTNEAWIVRPFSSSSRDVPGDLQANLRPGQVPGGLSGRRLGAMLEAEGALAHAEAQAAA